MSGEHGVDGFVGPADELLGRTVPVQDLDDALRQPRGPAVRIRQPGGAGGRPPTRADRRFGAARPESGVATSGEVDEPKGRRHLRNGGDAARQQVGKGQSPLGLLGSDPTVRHGSRRPRRVVWPVLVSRLGDG